MSTITRVIFACALLCLAAGLALSAYSFLSDIPLPWGGLLTAIGIALVAMLLAIQAKGPPA